MHWAPVLTMLSIYQKSKQNSNIQNGESFKLTQVSSVLGNPDVTVSVCKWQLLSGGGGGHCVILCQPRSSPLNGHSSVLNNYIIPQPVDMT